MESHRRANIKLVLPEVSGVELGTESNCQGLGVGDGSWVSIGDERILGEMVLVLNYT